MRFRTCQRAAVLLLIVATLQGGATAALADGKGPGGQSAPKGQPARVDPLAPFSQGASALAGMAAPFVNAASDAMFPRR